MKACSEIDPLVTSFLDGEAGQADRQAVGEHLQVCGPCRTDAAAEQAARGVLRARGEHLVLGAPPALRRTCRAAAHGGRRHSLRSWPLALAATLVLAVAGAFAYSTFINPAVAAAAQLTLDHLKCFTLFDQPDGLQAAAVRDALRARHGWEIPIPDHPGEGLTLVGGRHCVYLDGSVAHLLYKRGSVPVSVFVLPSGETLHAASVEVMGYAAVSFERGGRTWVVLAREVDAEVQAIANEFRED